MTTAARTRLGVLQGRLSPRPPDRLQAFPHASWREEFARAEAMSFDCLEWIFEAPGVEENPLCTAEGRQEIREHSARHSLPIASVCADYFMLRRLAGEPARNVDANIRVLGQLIAFTQDVGARRILLPLLETSAVDTPRLKDELVSSLRACLPVLEAHQITLGLEMELPGAEYLELIERIDHPLVGAYYDTGNSAAQGVDIAQDIEPLLPRLVAVHIKDRVVKGGSCPLGRGAANFGGFFSALGRSGFHGDFILQHFFDSDPEFSALRSQNFVRVLLARLKERAA